MNSSGLKAQGVPFNDDGSSAVQSVHVKVYTEFSAGGTDIPLRFDEFGNQDNGGTRDYVELTPQASTTTIRLPAGTYDFEATGLTTSEDGVTLAYQLLSDQAIHQGTASTPGEVTFHLKTLVGRASLEPVLPVTYVQAGQVLDLKLVVQTDEVPGGKRYAVPLSDFIFNTAPYRTSHGVDVLRTSQLGERVRIEAPEASPFPDDVYLEQSVQGTIAGGAQDDFQVSFARPYYPVTTLGVDLERPTLDVLGANYRGTSQIGVFPGDNVGVARVDVYEGVLLVASTDRTDPSVGSFTDGFFGELTYVTSPEVAHDFTVVATDTSGNEIRVPAHIDATPPYEPPSP